LTSLQHTLGDVFPSIKLAPVNDLHQQSLFEEQVVSGPVSGFLAQPITIIDKNNKINKILFIRVILNII